MTTPQASPAGRRDLMCVSRCTHAYHDALKADPVALRRHTTPRGVQVDAEGVVLFEYRQHRCGSYLAVEVEEGVPIHIGDDEDVPYGHA